MPAASDAVRVAVDALGGTVDQGGCAQLDVPLGPMTTYRVGGPAAIYVEVRTADDLDRVRAAATRSGLPVLPVGRGSNMLVADRGFAGIAIGLGALEERIEIDAATATARASAGVSLPVLARRTVAAGLTGFEWAVGVPGSVGGAVRMNAGGHGSDMAASLVEVTVVDLDGVVPAGESARRTVPVAELALGFRRSGLRPSEVVVDATLQLAPGDRAESERTLAEIVRWRRAHQPGGQNAGSVFVNPVPGEVSAGALIDAAGLRGRRVGTAAVSEKHANFIQADEDGSANDVYTLIGLVRDRVEAHCGVRLRSEIHLVGFGPDAGTGTDPSLVAGTR